MKVENYEEDNDDSITLRRWSRMKLDYSGSGLTPKKLPWSTGYKNSIVFGRASRKVNVSGVLLSPYGPVQFAKAA